MANESQRSEDTTTKEGKANVFLPTSVFYNPVQEFNRDLTIAVITQHAKQKFEKLKSKKNKEKAKNEDVDQHEGDAGDKKTNSDSSLNCLDSDLKLEAGKKYEEGLRILEGLSASGLRSIRFALEVPGIKEIIANDFNKKAVEFIEKNITENGVESLVQSSCADAAMVMYQNRRYENRFDVIDLDPYGSPVLFLDAAVQSVKDGGVLCVTCTDMAILCGNAAETCFGKYGAMSYRSKYCHEMALRIVLQSIQSHASRYSRYIEPLLSISVDFYVRVFVRVHTGQVRVKEVPTKLSMTYHCVGCGAFSLQPLASIAQVKGDNVKYSPASGPPVSPNCEHCNSRHIMGGPIWTGPLHDKSFVRDIVKAVSPKKSSLGTAERIEGVLNVVLEELPDQPLFYVIDELCKVLHCHPPKMLEIRSAILHAGYDVSLSHAEKNSLKTNAPIKVIWEILRCWVKLHPVSTRRLKDGSVAKIILDKEPELEANFTIRKDANPASRQKGLLRWQENPEKDWGPKARARCGQVESLAERRAKGIEKARNRTAKRHKNEENSELPYKKSAMEEDVDMEEKDELV